VLPMDASFCQKCGQPVAAPTYHPAVPSQAYAPPPAPARPAARSSRTWLWVLLGGLALVGICAACLLLTGVGAYLFPLMRSQSQPTEVAQPPAATEIEIIPVDTEIAPVETTEPTEDVYSLPTETVEPPTQATPLPLDTRGPYGNYQDDFSDLNSGWPENINDNYGVGYFQQQNYAISIFQPDYTAWVFPPHNLKGPFQEAIIQVRVKPDSNGGGFGIFCGYQDDQNYYEVFFEQGDYAIGKVVQDKYYPLTDPKWIKADNIQNVDEQGYIHLTVNCMQGSIGVEINDYGQKLVTDPDNSFPSGDVAIFASSGPAKKDGVYNQTLFDDFKLEVNPN
jgi:hypothetical protein